MIFRNTGNTTERNAGLSGMRIIMRLRNITGSRELIAASSYVVHNPEELKGHWKSHFGNDHPIFIEIGMGKGQFLTRNALLNPDINYIGIEKYSSVLLRAIEKQEIQQLPNLVFLRFDAEYIENIFAPGEIAGIFLNFSDPWPKDRHAKRRLTSRQFLERYSNILAQDAAIAFKTDNRPLFDFSVVEAEDSGWNIDVCTYDLHADAQLCEGNIMTEYEAKFSSMGNPIHKLVIHRSQDSGAAPMT